MTDLLLWWVGGVAVLIAFNRYVVSRWTVYRHHPLLVSTATIVAGTVVTFGVTALLASRGSSRSERAKTLGVIALGVGGYGAVLMAMMAAETWLVRHLVPRGARKPIVLSLFGFTAMAPLLIPSLLDWRRRRREARLADEVTAYLAGPLRPVRLWQVSKGGAVLGTVITGPRPMTQPSPEVGPDGLASLRLAEALASAAAELDLSAAGAGAEALLERALGGRLGLYGVSIGPAAGALHV